MCIRDRSQASHDRKEARREACDAGNLEAQKGDGCSAGSPEAMEGSACAAGALEELAGDVCSFVGRKELAGEICDTSVRAGAETVSYTHLNSGAARRG